MLALPVNCIGIGYAFLAMRKVVEALGIVAGSPVAVLGGTPDTVVLLAVVAVMVLVYTVDGGLWAVVITDFVQLLTEFPMKHFYRVVLGKVECSPEIGGIKHYGLYKRVEKIQSSWDMISK